MVEIYFVSISFVRVRSFPYYCVTSASSSEKIRPRCYANVQMMQTARKNRSGHILVLVSDVASLELWTFTMLRSVISTASRGSRNLTVAGARSVAVDRSATVPLACGGTAIVASSCSSVQAQYNRSFSAKKIVDIRRDEQRSVWDAYLLGSISADSVFQSLDLNKSGTITIEEINYFMESVHKAGVSEEAFGLLQKLGEDHALDVDEFERWLCMGTELRRVNPALEGILDNLDDSSSSDSSDDEEEASATSAPKMVDARRGLQQLVWETFLSTGEHGPDLFKMMDLNRNGRISVDEITYFMESVGAKGVDAAKFERLKALGEDHELNTKEFLAWLTSATGIDAAGGDIGGGPVEDAGGEHSPVRDNAEGCTPGQW